MSEDSVVMSGRGWSTAARTHVGLRRQNNQDAFICDPQRGLLVVIDGMGGVAAGEVAAAMTRDALLMGADLRPAIAEANRAILERGVTHPEEHGMGCVVTAVRLDTDEIRLAHVGDTRAYLASRVGCEQLTVDHTATAELRERLGMTAEQARSLPGAHQVTRDVGGLPPEEAESLVDERTVPVEIGDVLLLCSDGLHDLVREGELSRILAAARAPQTPVAAVADRLLALALDRGGHDNITLIVARRGEPDEEVTAPLVPSTPRTPTPQTTAPPSPRRPPPPPADDDTTEETGSQARPAGARRRRWPGCMLLVMGAGVALGAALLGILIGRGSVTIPAGPDPAPGVVAAVQAGVPLVAAGVADLDGTLAPAVPEAPAVVTVLGPLEAAGWARTVVPAGVHVEVRAAELRFPTQARWQIVLGPGSELTLRQGIIRAPELSLEVEVASGARLVLADSTIEAGRLRVTPPPEATADMALETWVDVRGGAVVLHGAPGVLERAGTAEDERGEP